MPKLQIIGGPLKGKIFDLEGATLFVGRSSRNDIQIEDPTISRKQFKLYFIGKKLFIEDLKSTNGTWLNDELIPPGEGFEVCDGDLISLGTTVMVMDESFPAGQAKEKIRFPSHPVVENLDSKFLEGERRQSTSKDLESLYSLTELIRSTSGLHEMLGDVLDTLLKALPRIERAAVILFDEEKKERGEVVSRSIPDLEHPNTGFSDHVIDRVIREGKSVRMSNTNYEAPSDISENNSTIEIGSLLCAPLVSHGKTYGVLYVDTLSGPYGFRKDDLTLLNAMSGALALAIEIGCLLRDK